MTVGIIKNLGFEDMKLVTKPNKFSGKLHDWSNCQFEALAAGCPMLYRRPSVAQGLSSWALRRRETRSRSANIFTG